MVSVVVGFFVQGEENLAVYVLTPVAVHVAAVVTALVILDPETVAEVV